MDNNYYNPRKEAMNRARQMQNNSKKYNNSATVRNVNNASAKPQPDTNASVKQSETPKSKQKPKPEQSKLHSEKQDLVDLILSDKERNIIILMIILLYEDKADKTLILALMYIIL